MRSSVDRADEAVIMGGGFADPVFDAQNVFRVAMDVLARPGTVSRLQAACRPPAPLGPLAGALALTLCDGDTRFWLDKTLGTAHSVRNWLRFHTGAQQVEFAGDADFAFVVNAEKMPSLEGFAQGTQDYPDRSTTLIVQVASLARGTGYRLEGPGIDGAARLVAKGLPAIFETQWAANAARFPRGVDLYLVAPEALAGLPRTTRLMREG